MSLSFHSWEPVSPPPLCPLCPSPLTPQVSVPSGHLCLVPFLQGCKLQATLTLPVATPRPPQAFTPLIAPPQSPSPLTPWQVPTSLGLGPGMCPPSVKSFHRMPPSVLPTLQMSEGCSMLGMRQTTGTKSRGGLQDLMIIWGKEAKSPGAARNAPSGK